MLPTAPLNRDPSLEALIQLKKAMDESLRFNGKKTGRYAGGLSWRSVPPVSHESTSGVPRTSQAPDCFGSPSRARTYDLGINSPSLDSGGR